MVLSFGRERETVLGATSLSALDSQAHRIRCRVQKQMFIKQCLLEMDTKKKKKNRVSNTWMHLCACWESMTELQIDSRHLASPLPALTQDSFTLNQTCCLKGLCFSESKIHFFPNYVRLRDCSYFIKRECARCGWKGQQLIPLVMQLAPEDPLIRAADWFLLICRAFLFP